MVDPSGLNVRVSDFPEALFRELSLKLDNTEKHVDYDYWIVLMKKLGLERQKASVRLKKNKTECLLRMWSYENPTESTGRRLVEVLNDMRRLDAALVVQYHLGEEYNPEGKETDDQFDDIDNAAKFNNVSSLRKLLKDKKGAEIERKFSTRAWSPLHSASSYGHLPAVKFLVEKGFFINRKNYLNETPIDVAVRESQEHVAGYLRKEATRSEKEARSFDEGFPQAVPRGTLDQAVANGDLVELRKLLEDGANPDDSGHHPWVPLHSAASRGNVHAIKLLVEYGADIDRVNFRSYNPEDWARFHRQHQAADYLMAVRKSKEVSTEKRSSEIAIPAVSPAALKGLEGDSIIGKILTVHRLDKKIDPQEFLVESEDLDTICEEIGKQLNITVAVLLNTRTEKPITSANELITCSDVIAVTPEEKLEWKAAAIGEVDPEASSLKPFHRQPKEPFVRVHLYRQYWSRSAEIVEFSEKEDITAILARASSQFHVDVTSLHTPDKLSRIPYTSILKEHERVIAKCEGDDLRSARTQMENLGVSSTSFGEFGSEGGKLVDPRSGVVVEIPEEAINEGEQVAIQIKVCTPNLRMDVGDDNLVMIGDPILIETTPPGYVFAKNVKFRIPHCGPTSSKAAKGQIHVLTAPHNPERKNATISFHKLSITEFDVSPRYIHMEASHFSFFWAFIYNVMTWGECVASVYCPPAESVTNSTKIQLQLLVHPNLPMYHRAAKGQILGGYVSFHKQCYLLGYDRATDVTAAVNDQTNWSIDPDEQKIDFHSIWRRGLWPNEDSVVVADQRFLLEWRHQAFPTRPVQATFTISGETLVALQAMVMPGEEGMLLNLSQPVIQNIARLLDPPTALHTGWECLADLLGYTLAEVQSFRGGSSPTRALLRYYMRRNHAIDDLKNATEAMDRRDVLDILNNVQL
eukprot:m.9976 g.9976  ORF g.9976 m.9976 type:complete len:920 (+) comp21788_c0_seq1:233-2992(+)